MTIKELANPKDKQKICNDILRALPKWFGIEAAIIDYTNQVQSLPVFGKVSWITIYRGES